MRPLFYLVFGISVRSGPCRMLLCTPVLVGSTPMLSIWLRFYKHVTTSGSELWERIEAAEKFSFALRPCSSTGSVTQVFDASFAAQVPSKRARK
jgi:hypothetical protein